MSAANVRRPGQHGAHPLSVRTRRKVLALLRDKALAGDAAAAEVLLRLGQQVAAEPAKRVPAVAHRT